MKCLWIYLTFLLEFGLSDSTTVIASKLSFNGVAILNGYEDKLYKRCF